jgi:acetyltransferase-like isoleucine patch superfamily enzyme
VKTILSDVLQSFVNRKKLSRLFPDVSIGKAVQIIGVDGVSLGKGSCIGNGVWINDCVRDGQCRIKVGRSVLVGRGSMLSTSTKLEIGDFTLTGPNCCFSNADHRFDDLYQPIMQQGASSHKSLIIEENCWFGFGASVLKGIRIGRGSVIGAGAVVLHDIPPFCIAVGCPAKIVKFYDFLENRWHPLPNGGNLEPLKQSREKAPPPSRDMYLSKLSANSKIQSIDACLAGP